MEEIFFATLVNAEKMEKLNGKVTESSLSRGKQLPFAKANYGEKKPQ